MEEPKFQVELSNSEAIMIVALLSGLRGDPYDAALNCCEALIDLCESDSHVERDVFISNFINTALASSRLNEYCNNAYRQLAQSVSARLVSEGDLNMG